MSRADPADVTLIGHRGCAGRYPENTVAAAERAVETATDLGCVAVHPPIDLATESGFVETVHEAGLAVNAWTVTDREDAERLLAAEVDGIIADRWDILPGSKRSSRD